MTAAVDIVPVAQFDYTTPSPSALELLDMCDARAGARYVARIRPVEKPGKNTVGTRCHEIAAEYLSKGTPPNRNEKMVIALNGSPKEFYPGRIVQAMVHHLPPAGTVPRVEHKVTLVHRGITFNAESSIDWETYDRVGDHKFTTAIKYALEKEAKGWRDPQKIIYAADWLARHPYDTVRAQWTYAQFDCKASKPFVLTASRAEIMKLLDDVVMPLAEKLLRYVADKVDWQTLRKNTGACGKYPPDGCPYASMCTRTQKERVQGIMASSLMDKLRAKKLGLAAPANEQAPVEDAAAQQLAAARALIAAAEAKSPIDDKTVASADADTSEVEDPKAAIIGAINPPGEAGDVLDAPDDKPATAPKRGRGRPKAAAAQVEIPNASAPGGLATYAKQLDKAVSQKNIDALVAANTPTTARVDSDEAGDKLGTSNTKSLVVLVDCTALRGMGDVTFASDLIAQAHAHVRKTFSSDAHECIDYRDGTPGVDYGKGAGFLVASVAALIEDLPSDTVVYLDTRSTEGMLCLQAFLSAATTVIRGAA